MTRREFEEKFNEFERKEFLWEIKGSKCVAENNRLAVDWALSRINELEQKLYRYEAGDKAAILD